ncbi:ClpP/crotonase-like domain-containing protein [Chytridium lagenaria]|nr:ClpP/crotonase-like domain-containing protein [Chytridium lagenaria]
MPTYEDISYIVENGIATVAFAREKSLNSMRAQTYRELRMALLEAAQDKRASITVQRDPPADSYESWEFFQQRLTVLTNGVTKAFIEHPKPLVVALNGPVVGFPAGVIAIADVIYASESATLHTPFTSLGLCSEGASSVGFVRRMGMGHASEALLFGRKFTAQELLATGFVQRVFPDNAFHAEVTKLLTGVAKNAFPVSLVATKRLIRDEIDREFARGAALELDVLTERFIFFGDPARTFQKLQEIASKKRSAKL